MKIKALNGFKDILPGETERWRYVENLARDIFARFNFSEIRLPILEKTELFARSIGEATDIVEKEMSGQLIAENIADGAQFTIRLPRANLKTETAGKGAACST